MLRALLAGPVLHTLWRLDVYLPPDRRMLERQILPRYAQGDAFPRVLFVGVARFSRRQIGLLGERAVTIDADPTQAPHGARRHIVDRLENLDAHFDGEDLDAIIANGVIGYGINSLQAVEQALSACHRHLRPGGELVLSTDEPRPCHGRLHEVAVLRDGFLPLDFPGLGRTARARIPWRRRDGHDFFFFQKR